MMKDIVGIFMGLIVVAGIMVAVKNGAGTAGVLKASSDGFATDIRAATGT